MKEAMFTTKNAIVVGILDNEFNDKQGNKITFKTITAMICNKVFQFTIGSDNVFGLELYKPYNMAFDVAKNDKGNFKFTLIDVEPFGTNIYKSNKGV